MADNQTTDHVANLNLRPDPIRRIPLGKTALRVLQMLADYGVNQLSHGRRYADIGRYGMYVMQNTNHLLRSQGMVEWAGGNYGRWHVRITDYGRECLQRRWHIPRKSVPFADTYGPRSETELLADANASYSDVQLEEIGR